MPELPNWINNKERFIFLALFLTIMPLFKSWGQSVSKYDSLLTLRKEEVKIHSAKNKVLNTRKNSFLVRYNPVSLTLKGAMLFYQNILSPQLGTNCPYQISCSNFSKACIREFGIIKGLALTSDRLTRCTPFTNLDFNPVYMSSNNKIIDPPSFYRFKQAK